MHNRVFIGDPQGRKKKKLNENFKSMKILMNIPILKILTSNS